MKNFKLNFKLYQKKMKPSFSQMSIFSIIKDEEEKVEEDNEDEEDDFIVPHGYLSDDEGVDKDDEEVRICCSSRVTYRG